MKNETALPAPPEWRGLTAKGTRYGLLADLYEIIHWNEPKTFSKEGFSSLIDYWDFFCEDFMFRDNPKSMIGQSLFEDEIPYVQKFIDTFAPFLDNIPDEILLLPRDQARINPPSTVIGPARELYQKLLEKGDPKIEQYLK